MPTPRSIRISAIEAPVLSSRQSIFSWIPARDLGRHSRSSAFTRSSPGTCGALLTVLRRFLHRPSRLEDVGAAHGLRREVGRPAEVVIELGGRGRWIPGDTSL